ncbi:receptor-like protein EIX1 [Gastrolobium bilobum]|uniref:receptor-like protein EIX1 n=1 Tax=Gastrolobium bilobum TaxID=150636 RepID=UPI002AAF2D08|nr:receptor-like protein EIX1 [Gastrolobium bilobum]
MSKNNLNEDLPWNLHDISSGCVRYSLQELDLSYNEITSSIPDLSIFLSLKTLDLSENQLRKIHEGCILSSQLESLFIKSNSLEGGIPKSFGNAFALRSLDLSNNNLSGELPVIIHHSSGCARYSPLNGKIPEDIRFPSQLEELYMYSNSLEGVISDSHFANMSKLEWLDLSDDSLTVAFRKNWIPSFQLQDIGLRSCKLGPAFPKWLQTQNDFKVLDISNCGISDIVPKWFWAKFALSELSNINISYNKLKGTIPNLPVKKTPFSFTLASNQFDGSIPPFLRDSLSLDLSKNKFPDSLWFLCANGTVETLAQLDLSNNYFSGQIPDCWSHFKSLAYLDLSHNNFSEKIPTSMGLLPELQLLDLSLNNLSGRIPKCFTNFTSIAQKTSSRDYPGHMYLSNPGGRLSDDSFGLNAFLMWKGVEQILAQIDRLAMLDFSHNHLSGKIPTGTQLQSFNVSSYEDNLDLCGKLLENLCTEAKPQNQPIVKSHEDEYMLFTHGFYVSMAFGFFIGFWGIFGSILVNRSLRHAYFRILNNLTHSIYIMIAVKVK